MFIIERFIRIRFGQFWAVSKFDVYEYLMHNLIENTFISGGFYDLSIYSIDISEYHIKLNNIITYIC